MRACLDQRGAALVSALVVMVVVSLVILGMMQLALASYRVGKFEEERQQALAAAESGIAVALARLTAGQSIPKAIYPSSIPSIDSSSADWLGPGTGRMPSELTLAPRASFKVWVSEAVNGKMTLVAEGRCGGRTRVVQVNVTQVFSVNGIKFVVAATSTGSRSIAFNGLSAIDGDIYTASKSADAIHVAEAVVAAGKVYVPPDADIEGIRDRLDGVYDSDDVIPESTVYSYPPPVPPTGLPRRGSLDLRNASLTIADSGEYDYVEVKGPSIIKIDTRNHDVVFRVKEDFNVSNATIIYVTGPHAFKLYVDGNIKGFGAGGMLTGGDPTKLGDPTKFIIYCRGQEVNYNGVTGTTAVIYAPNADVAFRGAGIFIGAVVARTFTLAGFQYIHYPSDQYGDVLRELDLGPVEGAPSLEIESWREINPTT